MAEQLSLFPEGNNGKEIKQAEWCFQFFDNEPVVFGWTKDESESSNLVIELRPMEDDTLTFQQNGMVFKIFPREMTEESKKLREEQKQQNENQNQETKG
jgi:uncharacterized protein YbaA (DUF1428 family)